MECRSLLFQSRCGCRQFGTTSKIISNLYRSRFNLLYICQHFLSTDGSGETLCGPQNAECEEKLGGNFQYYYSLIRFKNVNTEHLSYIVVPVPWLLRL